jgi:alanyl-tRNA synthetase
MLDITHHKPLTDEEVKAIEKLANAVVDSRLPVRKVFMDRNEAERKYGFAIYEGGVPMERQIRLVEIEGWDAEACFGTHLDNTGEIGGIKIINVERIQDGVVRLEFIAGTRLYEEMAKAEDEMKMLAKELKADPSELPQEVRKLKDEVDELREAVRSYRSIWVSQATEHVKAQQPLNGVRVALLVYPERDVKSAREALREITDEVSDSLVVLAIRDVKGYRYEIGAGRDVGSRTDVGELIKRLSSMLSLQGGGKGTYGSFSTAEPPEKVLEAIKRVLGS